MEGRGAQRTAAASSPALLCAERALYSCEVAFHPLFSITTGLCRLPYRRRENR